MDNVFFMAMRRMRTPLIVLIVAYAIALIGLVLAPGENPDGTPWNLSFFHAFYIISYTATTIGFGEIPQPLSDIQRGWVIITIYITVIAWLYSIGTILTLLQEPAFRNALTFNGYARRVRRIAEPFYVICGYGETGSRLVASLDHHNIPCVVIDIDPERVGELELQDYRSFVPGLCADAAIPGNLVAAGLNHALCRGVVALTNNDSANLAIAVTVKLINPKLPVLCRSESQEVAANMDSFGTDHIINPFEVFGDHFAVAITAPGVYLLHEWLFGTPGLSLANPIHPPRGRWVICGYGRFGKAVARHLADEGIETRIIEANPQLTGCSHCIVGKGTEAATLLAADIENAAGIVAGTNDDIDNLSIVMTARELNQSLFVVLRKNRQINAPLFGAVNSDLLMQPARIVSQECLARLTNPLMSTFLSLCRGQDNEWANELISCIAGLTGDTVPDTWTIHISPEHAPALTQELRQGMTIGTLVTDPTNREERLRCLPLLVHRVREVVLLPGEDEELERGDRILFCGTNTAEMRQHMTLYNYNVLRYVLRGEDRPEGTAWRWLDKIFFSRMRRMQGGNR